MKLILRSIRLFCMAVAMILFGSSFARGASGSGDGRLVIQRSPKFGSNMYLDITIDGKKAANVGQGRQYDQPISGGHHVITVNYSPITVRPPNSMPLDVKAGETYKFVATWDNARGVLLRPSK